MMEMLCLLPSETTKSSNDPILFLNIESALSEIINIT